MGVRQKSAVALLQAPQEPCHKYEIGASDKKVLSL